MFSKTENLDQKGWAVILLGVILALGSIAMVSTATSILPAEIEYARLAMVAGSVVCGIFGVMMISGDRAVK